MMLQEQPDSRFGFRLPIFNASNKEFTSEACCVSSLNLPSKKQICNAYTPTAIMLARYVTHMNTQSPGGICYASLEVGWYSKYQPTSTKA